MRKTLKSGARAILLGPLAQNSDKRKFLSSLQIKPQDFLIGIDGGTQVWLKWGFQPDFAIGDWDSLGHKKVLSRIPHVTLTPNKDRSDLFYGVIAAIEAGAKQLVCLGVTGGRPDHHLATLNDLSTFSTGRFGQLESVSALGIEGEYHFLSTLISRWEKKTSPGEIVSIFAMNEKVEGVTLSGLRYLLRDATVFPSSLGLSNVVKKRKVGICLRKGQLLVIMPRNEFR
jgi:thiamine pyrophosphokinase